MSQQNLVLVERVVAAVNGRDVDGYVACCADDIKLRTPWAAVEGVYEGPEAIRRFFADLQDWAPDFRLTIERAEPIGATRVLVFLRASLSGRASGLPAAAMSGGLGDAPTAGLLSTATVFDFAGGMVASIRVFLDRDQALKAVGLAEPDTPTGRESRAPCLAASRGSDSNRADPRAPQMARAISDFVVPIPCSFAGRPCTDRCAPPGYRRSP